MEKFLALKKLTEAYKLSESMISYAIDTDFGFAQYLHSEEETQTMRGSPLYMVSKF